MPVKEKHLGMRVYYRRQLKNGSVILYLKNQKGQKTGRIVVDGPETAAKIPAGVSYTMENRACMSPKYPRTGSALPRRKIVEILHDKGPARCRYTALLSCGHVILTRAQKTTGCPLCKRINIRKAKGLI